jgi:hypothetical protein
MHPYRHYAAKEVLSFAPLHSGEVLSLRGEFSQPLGMSVYALAKRCT